MSKLQNIGDVLTREVEAAESALRPPPNPERDARVAACGDDFFLFARTYLSHYFSLPPADFHRELMDAATTEKMLLSIAPRGHAKTTLFMARVLWDALYGRCPFQIWIADSHFQAEGIVESIMHELESNEAIVRDFGDVRGERWTREFLSLFNGCAIVARGTGQKIRGIKWRQHRPKVICDDLQNDENVASKGQRDKDHAWFNAAVIPAVAKGGQIVLIATILHADDLPSRLKRAGIFTVHEYDAILAEPGAAELWDEWRGIFRDKAAGGPAEAGRFYRRHQDEMDKGARVCWPAAWPYLRLMEEREKIGSVIFNREYRHRPVDPETAVFNEEWFRYYEPHHLPPGLRLFGACDPATGKKGGDLTGRVTIGVAPDGYIYVLQAEGNRLSFLATAEAIVRDGLRFKHLGYAVETVGYQVALAEHVEEISRRAFRFIRLRRLQNHVDKASRLGSLSALVENGTIRFNRDHHQLLDEMRFYPKGEHDDILDALEMAVRIARKGASGGRGAGLVSSGAAAGGGAMQW